MELRYEKLSSEPQEKKDAIPRALVLAIYSRLRRRRNRIGSRP